MYKKQLNCPAFLFATWLKYSVKNKRICIFHVYISSWRILARVKKTRKCRLIVLILYT